ncbi:PAS domain-containing protein [Bacteroidota bacterium]
MGDKEKTKSQLLSDNDILRNRILELEEAQRNNEFLERALLDSEQRYRDLYENAPLGYQSLDDNGNIVEVNDAWCKSLGFQREDVIGTNYKGYLTPKSQKKFGKGFSEFKKTGKVIGAEFEFRKKNGSLVIMSLDAKASYDIHGNFKQSHCIMHDIAERKQSEDALHESEYRLRNVLETVNLIAVSLDTNGDITFCNDFLLNLTGWKQEEVIGISWFEIFIPQDIRKSLKKSVFLKTLRTGGFPVHYENEIMTRNGERRLIVWNNTVYRNPDGEVAGTTSIGEDITERKRAMKALQESEERYRSLIELSPDAIAVTDMDGNFILVNQKTVELLGYSSIKELIGMNSISRVAPEERNVLQKRIEINLKNHIPQSFEQTFIRKDGSRFPAETIAQVLLNEDCQVYGFLSIVRDITERKYEEKALKESEERFRKLSESAFEGIVISDKGKIRDANKQIAEMLKIKPNELIGMNVIDFVAPESRDFVEKHIKSGSEESYMHLARRKDSSIFPVEVQAKSLPFEGQMLRVTSIRDITERKQAEEALRIAEENYRSIFENAVEGIYQTTTDGKFISANPAIAKMLGYKSPKELMEKVSNVEKQLYVDVNRRREFRKLINIHDDVRNFETQLYNKSGKKIWVSLHSRAVRDSKRKIQFYEGTMEDITERRLSEERLKISEELNRAINENSPIGISVRSSTGKLLGYNESWKSIWAMSQREINEDRSRDRKKLIFDKRDKYLGKWQANIEKIYKEGGTLYIPELKINSRKKKAAKWISSYFYAIKK